MLSLTDRKFFENACFRLLMFSEINICIWLNSIRRFITGAQKNLYTITKNLAKVHQEIGQRDLWFVVCSLIYHLNLQVMLKGA